MRILEATGTVYVDGTVYTVYNVFNFSTGAVESHKSLSSDLAVGSDYALGANGLILNVPGSSVSTGVVTGYTSGTVTIDNKVYTLASNVIIKTINADKTVSNVALSSLLNKTVEFIASGSVVKVILTH